MKNLVPYSEVEKNLELLHEKIKTSLLNAIEQPLTTDDFSIFGYPSKKSMQNDLKRLPVHKAPNGKYFIYLSEFNEWVKKEGKRL